MRKRRSHSDNEEGFEYSTGSPVSALSVECFASHSQLGDDRITYTHFVELLCEFCELPSVIMARGPFCTANGSAKVAQSRSMSQKCVDLRIWKSLASK